MAVCSAMDIALRASVLLLWLANLALQIESHLGDSQSPRDSLWCILLAVLMKGPPQLQGFMAQIMPWDCPSSYRQWSQTIQLIYRNTGLITKMFPKAYLPTPKIHLWPLVDAWCEVSCLECLHGILKVWSNKKMLWRGYLKSLTGWRTKSDNGSCFS